MSRWRRGTAGAGCRRRSGVNVNPQPVSSPGFVSRSRRGTLVPWARNVARTAGSRSSSGAHAFGLQQASRTRCGTRVETADSHRAPPASSGWITAGRTPRYLQAHVRDESGDATARLGERRRSTPRRCGRTRVRCRCRSRAVSIRGRATRTCRRRGGAAASSSRSLLQALELVFDSRPRGAARRPRPGSQFHAFVIDGLPHVVGRRLRRRQVEPRTPSCPRPLRMLGRSAVAADLPPRDRYRNAS